MTNETDPLTLNEIDVVRAPGFESEGFSVDDVSPGVNIVHGPNAAGKTTLAKSLQWLLWPDACADYATLIGTLSLNGDEWRVELDGGRVTYQRDGQEANGPTLPPEDQRDRYLLSLHDLLQHDTRNETFAETIERESAGGYDLSAAHTELGYDDSPSTRRKNVVKEAENAVKEWRDAQSAVTELRREQDRLSRLRDELEEAKDAKTEVDLFDQAIEYVKAQNDLQDAKSRLEEFPDVLEHVDGDEFDEVSELESEIQEWEEKRRKAEQSRNEARAQLKEVDLPDDGISDGQIEQLKAIKDDLKSAEERKRNLESDLEGAKHARANARQDIPLNVDQTDLVELEPVTWKDVSQFARRAEQVRAKRKSQAAIEDHFDETDWPNVDPSSLQRGCQALEQWLATPAPATPTTDNTAFRIALVSSALLSVAGIALGLLVHPLFFVTLLAAASVFLYGYMNRTETDSNHNPRSPHRESFEQTGLTAPASWTEEDVRARLVELYEALAQHEVAEKQEQLYKTLTPDQEELEAAKQTLEETRAELQSQLGAAPDTTDVELTVLTKRVLDWQEAHDEVVDLQAKLETVTDQLAACRNQLREELEPYGYDNITDAVTAVKAIRDLERRKSTHEKAQQTLSRETETIEEADEKIEALESEWESIFLELDLEPGDHDTLRALCEQVGEYEKAVREVEDAQVLAQKEKKDLKEFEEYDPSLEEQTIPELENERREAAAVADNYDDIRDEITEIETKIDQAKRDDTVETAIAEKERALDALREQLEDDCAAMVGDVLVDYVQETTLEAGRPDVFQRAREILATITRGRYRLDFDEDETSFRAFDTAKQKGFGLDELSSGTRLQVLLSVRIAFVEQQEHGVRLPLVLDETLANSDDLRADVIIESVIELAREGRQVFYLTAQGDEVAKWCDALDGTTTVDHAVIDLADARDLDRRVKVPDVAATDSLHPEPPSPDEYDHESYGEALDVPSFNPHRGVEAAHLWYVVDDVETLYKLLKLGIERWGQLNNLLERGRGESVIDDADRLLRIKQNADALDAFVQAWKVGRGKPVDRQVLEDSGAVSNTFIDEVTELAESVNGDAERIIEALRDGQVDRFRSDKTDELETYFEENGYIEPTKPLTDDQIRLRVVERFLESDISQTEANDRTTELLSRLN